MEAYRRRVAKGSWGWSTESAIVGRGTEGVSENDEGETENYKGTEGRSDVE